MSSEDSDLDLRSALPKKITKKIPQSPTETLLKEVEKKVKLTKTEDPKKLSTKMMIHQALTDLNTRKGVSLYAIKKYLSANYEINTDKINYIMKKYLKTAVEKGTILQTKGIGASGSFKLAPVKEKKKTKPKKNKEEVKEKKELKSLDKTKKQKGKLKKSLEKDVKPKMKKIKSKSDETQTQLKSKLKKQTSKEKVPLNKTEENKSKGKMPKRPKLQTPSKKKAAMVKRKSIGSLIKPPKMRPAKS